MAEDSNSNSNSASFASAAREINLFVAVTTHGTTEFDKDGKLIMFRIPERINMSYINLSTRCGLSLQKAADDGAPEIVYGQPLPPGETSDNIISNIAEVAITTHDVLQQIAYLSHAIEDADETKFTHYKYSLAEALKMHSDRVMSGWVKTTKLNPLMKSMTGSIGKLPLAALRADSRQFFPHGLTERDIMFAQWYSEANEHDSQVGSITEAEPGTMFPDYLYTYNPKTESVTEDSNIIVIMNTGENLDDAMPLRKRPLSYVLGKLEEKYPGVKINVCVVSFACSTTKVNRHSVSERYARLLNRTARKDPGEMEKLGGRTRKKRRHRYTRRKQRKLLSKRRRR